MKKCLFALIAIALSVACAKEKDINTIEDKTVDNKKENSAQAGEMVTISATLPEDLLTKVTFTPTIEGGKPTAMGLKWATGDKIRIYDHSDRTKYNDFTLEASSVGETKGIFSGETTNISAATAFDVEIVNDAVVIGSQTQKEDGNTEHLKYYAPIENIADYSSLTFTNISNILAITAKMPSSEVAAAIKTIEIKASDNDFFDTGVNTLTITLTNKGDAGDDGILHLFANLPQENKAIAAGTSLVVHFNAPETAHTVYTRYIELGASNFTAGKLNTININASNSTTYANASTTSIGESTNPYLIGDKNQLQAISLSTTKQYYKLVDDIDLYGVSWTSLNADGTNVIDLDGNGKTISHLNKPLFDDLNGKVINLTIEDAVMDGGSSITGILANTIKTAASTVTNVDVVGTITTPSYSSSITATAYVGGLIGQIDAGSTNITDCDVSNTNVSGTLAGGVVGFANALVTMSGCTYSGGTVSASARYCGGMLGSTGDFSSKISDCHVENATITSTSDRVGGFIGQIQTNVQVKGCTVGTSSQKVTINSNKSGSTVNVGGFVGVCYGTVTKNVDVRSKAYVTINSTNTSTTTNVNIGGFVGFLEKATIEYSDSDVSMSSIKGAQVGGFAAWLVGSGSGCTISHCTMTGTVSGNNYVGGFIGNTGAANHTISYNSSTGTVSGAATVGGFAGQATQGGWTGNTTSSTVVGSGANIGGFAGQINGNVIVSRCSSTGATATASGNVCGGFTAIASNGANISDCFTTTNLAGATRKRGGLVGHVTEGTVSITRCYSTSTISANFELGGLIGVVADGATFTLSKSVAWNASITASNHAASNWSSASIVGVSSLTCTLTDNYRNPDMVLTAYWGTNAYDVELTSSFQQPNVSSTSPLTDWNGNEVTSGTMRPYNGKCETGKTLSQLASTTLGWLDTVWDFSTDLPTLLP